MRKRTAIAIVGGLVVALVLLPHAFRSRRSLDRRAWAQMASAACWRMQNRISAEGWAHWKPLADRRPLGRIAVLRRELLELHRAGLREILAHGPPPDGPPARAVVRYRRMLVMIRDVARAAERRDVAAYRDADVRMVLAIQATRTAFEQAGTENICNFAI